MDIDSLREGLLGECVVRTGGCFASTFGINGFWIKILAQSEIIDPVALASALVVDSNFKVRNLYSWRQEL